MSFEWQYYLRLAQRLYSELQGSSNGDTFSSHETEALCRTVVSRAYYAVYCLARNYAQEHDGYESHGNDHRELQNHFTQNTSLKLKCRIGNQLRQLHQSRIKADYFDELTESAINSASKALSQASRIHDNLKDLQK